VPREPESRDLSTQELRSSLTGVRIRTGTLADTESIASLINKAFIVERVAFDGNRTSSEKVRALFESGSFLLAESRSSLVGCVYLETRGPRGYLGLLSVDPLFEGQGLGRRLMDAAERHARSIGLDALDLRIISPRAEALLPFYRKLGYAETGVAPMDPAAKAKVPCHFVTMFKILAPQSPRNSQTD
jgi:GNAT superfamily N-acetyltransferase